MDKAVATQLANIEKRSGKTLAELGEILRASGLAKHGELRDYLKRELGMGHGDANATVHHVMGSGGAAEASGKDNDALLDAIYTGPKAALRPIHDKLMAAMAGFGDFEIAPKKGYLSLRRKKQFAMLGPATNTRVELGLNMKGLAATTRLLEQAPGGMCNCKVRLTDAAEVDAELLAWARQAYDSAG